MFKSIRVQWLLFNGLLLGLVIGVFGTLLYFAVRKTRIDEIDAEMHQAIRVLEGSLRGRPVLPEGKGPPEEGFDKEKEGQGFKDKKFKGPGFKPKEKGPPPPALPPVHFNKNFPFPPLAMQHSLEQRYQGNRAPYFAVWLHDELMQASKAEQELPPWDEKLVEEGSVPYARQRGDFREILMLGPHKAQLLVGRSVAQEMANLGRFLRQMILIGAAVWFMGLGAGLLLTNHLLKPLQTISAAAAEMSAHNLSRRIDLGETQSELGQLANILNVTFARLEASFAQQVRFSADASHELRTPLTVLSSHLELALARDRTGDEYRDTLKTCQRACQRMKALMETLLTLARIDSGEFRLERCQADLALLIEDCLELIRPLAARNHIQIEAQLPSVMVLADPHRISQVIINLLTNAVSYNRPQGRITIALEEEPGWVSVSIVDTGVGIAPEEMSQLFERFYRADPARTRAGHGLGLAICQSIVQAHGGKIEVASTPGQGTTFRFRLPRE